MRIGLVLSKPPAYSETFFNAKIKGLQEKGHEVVLFCQTLDHADEITSNEKVNTDKTTTKPYEIKQFTATKGSFFKRVLLAIQVFFKVLPYTTRVLKWYALEKNKGIIAFLKNVYINAPLLTSNLDWIHYGFATMALNREQLAKAIGAKMAVSFRGYDMAIYPLKNPNCYQQLWQNVDKIHTISDDLLEIAYIFGLPKTIPVIKITPAIDVTFFKPNSTPLPETKQLVRLLTVGRLHWKKGHTFILQALELLKAKRIAFKYVIVGTGTQKEQERIRFAVQQLNLEDNVIFKGKLDQQAVKEAYQQADIYIQYSISEGFCNAVLEAQAMKVLSVVSNAEGLPENVLHNQTGWVVPKLTPQLLVKQLEEIILLSELEKEKIRQQAQQRVQKKFTIQKQQEAFNAFYTT